LVVSLREKKSEELNFFLSHFLNVYKRRSDFEERSFSTFVFLSIFFFPKLSIFLSLGRILASLGGSCFGILNLPPFLILSLSKGKYFNITIEASTHTSQIRTGFFFFRQHFPFILL